MAVNQGLVLIGMGPGGVDSMTIAAIHAAIECDLLLYESYTALWDEEELVLLEKIIGRVTKVMRPQVEAPDWIIEEAKVKRVGVLVVGDPLQATTHTDLRLRAIDAGINCDIVHGISITGLVTGAIGLSNYKFGRQTTIPYPYENWIATSPLEVIAENLYRGMHTLALLDLDPTGKGEGEQVPMTPRSAYEALMLMNEKMNTEDLVCESALDESKKFAIGEFKNCEFLDIPVVLCSDMGTENQMIEYTNLSKLREHAGGRMNCLVFPATPSEIENQALQMWSKN